jgi:uncharacterized RmlC-like cupin family protein
VTGHAVTTKRTGATKLWAGTVTIEPAAKTGTHHHGDLESVIYVVSGLARMRWGDRLEFVAEAARSTRAKMLSFTACWHEAGNRASLSISTSRP